MRNLYVKIPVMSHLFHKQPQQKEIIVAIISIINLNKLLYHVIFCYRPQDAIQRSLILMENLILPRKDQSSCQSFDQIPSFMELYSKHSYKSNCSKR